MASSSTVPYTVFISHADEDKATIAIPLRQELISRGTTAFVDEIDLRAGDYSDSALTNAMNTAKVAVVVMSPEFVARKQTMKELLHFLKRGDGRGPNVPVIIPFYYRLSVEELDGEPRLDRLDKDGNSLCRMSKFLQRMEKGEPEANIAGIRTALAKLQSIIGVINYLDASNDSAHLMSRRRELLLLEVCEKVRQAIPSTEQETAENNVIMKETVTETGAEVDAFHAQYRIARGTKNLVFSFLKETEEGFADTPEGRLLEIVMCRSPDEKRVICVHGIAGVGKTSVLIGLSELKRIKKRFEDGVYFISLGMNATRHDLITELSNAVESSGGRSRAREMRTEKDFGKVVKRFCLCFAEKQCLFIVDDVWENQEVSTSITHKLVTLHESGRDSKVLMSTRNPDIASRADTCISLKPLEPLDERSYAILIRYSKIRPKMDSATKKNDVEEILQICSGLPLFLAVAGKTVRTLSLRSGCNGDAAYNVYASSLNARKESFLVTGVDSYERLESTLRVSVNLLEERRQTQEFVVPLTAADMHRRLSVLEKQEKVPMTMLRHLWELNSQAEAAVFAHEFEQVALADIEVEEDEGEYKEILRLHDSLHLFASKEARIHGEEKTGYEAIVRGYGKGLEEIADCRAWWSDKIKRDGYLHAHICSHLLKIGRGKEVAELLLHPEWTARMIAVCGIASLEHDLSLCISELNSKKGLSEKLALSRGGASSDTALGGGSEMARALELVLEAVSLSAGFIMKNEREMWFQMYGRLKGYSTRNRVISGYLERVYQKGPRPRLWPVNCFLKEPGSANRRIVMLGFGVRCMTIMNDFERVVCGCDDRMIFIVNVVRGEIEDEWKTDGFHISAIAVSRDGKRVVAALGSGKAAVWNTETHPPSHIATIESQRTRGVMGISFLPGTGCDMRAVSVFFDGSRPTAVVGDIDVDTGLIESEYPALHVGYSFSSAVMPDGETLVTGETNGTLRMWNIVSGAQVGPRFLGRTDEVLCLAVTPDGRYIVSGSRDGLVRKWDVLTHVQIGAPFEGQSRAVYGVDVSPGGKRIVSGSVDGRICVWDAETGKEACNPLEAHVGSVTGVSFLGSDNAIVSSSDDGTVRLWVLGKKNKERHVDRHEASVRDVIFTPNGEHVVSSSNDSTVRIWDPASGGQVGDPLDSHDGSPEGLAVTADGQKLVSISVRGTVCVRDMGSRELLGIHNIGPDQGQCTAVSPKGDFVVIMTATATARFFDITGTGTGTGGSPIVCEIPVDTLCARVYARGWSLNYGYTSERYTAEGAFVTEDGLRVVFVISDNFDHQIVVWDMPTRQIIKRVTLSKRRSLTLRNREVMDIVGEETSADDSGLSIPLEGYEITYRRGEDTLILGTLDAPVADWAVSPDKTTLCVGLKMGHVGFMKLEL